MSYFDVWKVFLSCLSVYVCGLSRAIFGLNVQICFSWLFCCLWSVDSHMCVCLCVWLRVFRGQSESLHYAWKAFRQRACQAPSCQFIWFGLWNGVMKCETSGLKCFDYPYTLWPSISISLLWDVTYVHLSMIMVICSLV